MTRNARPRDTEVAPVKEKSAVEKRLENFLNATEPIDDGNPLPPAASIEFFKQEREMWVNTLKHTRDLYGLACNVKDERRKGELWDNALKCMKWKEELDRKIAALQKQVKEMVEVSESNPVIEE